MVRFDDPTLMAFAEGELPPAEAALVEAALAENPALAERLQRLRGVRTALRAAYDSVANEPVPEHLRALLGDVAIHEPLATTAQPPPPSGKGVSPVVLVIGAVVLLAIGIVIGGILAT